MRDEFDSYRAELDSVKLSDTERGELMEKLTAFRPAHRTCKGVLRTVMIAAVLCIALLVSAFAADAIIRATTADGSVREYWFDEDGDEISCLQGVPELPVELRDGRIWIVAGGREKDITDLIDDETPYIVFVTMEDGNPSCLIVGGTPELYGYATLWSRSDGILTQSSGVYSWEEVLNEGTICYDHEVYGDGYVIEGREVKEHYFDWYLNALDQLEQRYHVELDRSMLARDS